MSCYYSLPKFRARLEAMRFYYPRHVFYFPFLSFLCSDLGAVRCLSTYHKRCQYIQTADKLFPSVFHATGGIRKSI